MNTLHLTDAVQARPFKAFTIVMDSGVSYPVEHPELVIVLEEVVILADGRHIRHIDTSHISTILFTRTTAPQT